MARVSYRKKCEFKLFGIKIFEHFSDYYEHSSDKDDDDDEENIKLTKRIIERDN